MPQSRPVAPHIAPVPWESVTADRVSPSASSLDLRGEIKPKLEIGDVNDPHEQEADEIADWIMRMPAPSTPRNDFRLGQPSITDAGTPVVRRECRECAAEQEPEEEMEQPALVARRECASREAEDDELRRHATTPGTPGNASPSLASRVHDLQRAGGRHLGASAQTFLEPRLGVGLDNVRVHADAESGRVARQINARAFTVGQHVFLRPG